MMSNLFASLLCMVDVSMLEIELEDPDLVKEINITTDSLQKNILHILTDNQSVEVLRCVLRKIDKGLLNGKSANGQTPLCFGLTAKPTNEDFFLELISNLDCDVTIPDKRHLTPLHYAVFYREHRIAQRLLQRGVNIDAKSITDITPLYLAVENNDYEMVCMLLYYNADVNIECEENNPSSRAITSPLLHCIDREFLDLAELLLDYIADVNEPVGDGMTLLYHAICNASQITYLILERGGNINHICYGKHCIMAVGRIPGAVTRKKMFDYLWPMVDIKYMMDYCPHNLYDLFFKYNLLSDQFFASVFVDYDVEDTFHFAKTILEQSEYEACLGVSLVSNRTEESVLSLFCSLLLVCNQVSGNLLCEISKKYGIGKLFWTFVDTNVQIVDYESTVRLDNIISMFVSDVNLMSRKFPSLAELSRTLVRQSCRRVEDLENNRYFAFLNRIKMIIGLPKICQDILLLRKPHHHF